MPNPLSKRPRKDFYAAPYRPSWSQEIECNSLVLLPPKTTRLPDSGYRLMDAVACLGDTILCRVAEYSDVFHFDIPSDIWTKERTPTRASTWNIDCLARSGLFRVFTFGENLFIGAAVSSLYIHPILKEKPND